MSAPRSKPTVRFDCVLPVKPTIVSMQCFAVRSCALHRKLIYAHKQKPSAKTEG